MKIREFLTFKDMEFFQKIKNQDLQNGSLIHLKIAKIDFVKKSGCHIQSENCNLACPGLYLSKCNFHTVYYYFRFIILLRGFLTVSYIVRKGDCAILHKNPSYFA